MLFTSHSFVEILSLELFSPFTDPGSESTSSSQGFNYNNYLIFPKSPTSLSYFP